MLGRHGETRADFAREFTADTFQILSFFNLKSSL